MEVNYDRLILGSDIPINENVTIHIPTIRELADGQISDYMVFTRVFVTTVREQFSGAPSDVDKIEEKFPTFWDMMFDEEMNQVVGQMMFGEGIDLMSVAVHGLAYWTKTDVEGFRPLSNHKIVNEKLNWIIDSKEYEQFCNYIRMITLSEPNEDLIAPKGISSKPRQCQVWLQLYKGRIRSLQQKGKSLGDKILLLQALAPSYFSFRQIGELTAYQFENLLITYQKRMANERDFAMFTAYKFDSDKIKLSNLSEEVGLVKLKK